MGFAFGILLGRKLEVQHVSKCLGWVSGFINPSLFLQWGERAADFTVWLNFEVKELQEGAMQSPETEPLDVSGVGEKKRVN